MPIFAEFVTKVPVVFRRPGIEMIFKGFLKWRTLSRGRSELIKGDVSPRVFVPPDIPAPQFPSSRGGWYKMRSQWYRKPRSIQLNDHNLQAVSGNLAARALAHAVSIAKPGITTDDIDKSVHNFIVDHKGYPSPLGYYGYPKSMFTSINEGIIHGIPDNRDLEEGDVLKMEIGVWKEGYHSAVIKTIIVGDISNEENTTQHILRSRVLVKATEKALDNAIQECQVNAPIKNIAIAIEKTCMELNKENKEEECSILTDFMSRGIGKEYHDVPIITHFHVNDETRLEEGMTIALEPVFAFGHPEWIQWADQWATVLDDSNGIAAQFGHTIAITKNGPRILTKLD